MINIPYLTLTYEHVLALNGRYYEEMATAGLKRQRLTLEVTFASENDKKMFQDKLAAAKRLLLPPHRRDACSFLNAMLDRILVPTGTYDASTPPVLPPAGSSFLDTSGAHSHGGVKLSAQFSTVL